MFDVVTTSIYRYRRYDGGPELEDRTLALKLFAGRHQTRAYPATEELIRFGRKVCEVSAPQEVLRRIAAAMREVLASAKDDARIPVGLLRDIDQAWQAGLAYATNST